MKAHGFIIALFVAILLAYLFPTALSDLPLKQITNIGIGLIFFFYGLKLAPSELKLGFLNYRSHILIQLTTFVVFPLLTLLFIPFFDGGLQSRLWLAILFLGALPSTVSSAVIMVAIARGNLPTAIFNATISGLIGIVATPLWLSIFMMKSGEFEILDILLKLFLQVLLPLIIGLLLQPYLGKMARFHSSKLSLFDKSVIVLIVFNSFSNSFTSNLFDTIKVLDLLKLFGIVLVLFFLIYGLIGYVCKLMDFGLKDTITAKFCGSQKSLIHGTVMVKIIFGNSASLGLFLLPIMFYHILQLLLISIFAENYRKRTLQQSSN
ncbi:MAG: bile acid:sodium symporter [Flavobacteriaceae bacterium]|nr:bile acid:sodium symporter [Flavobacteriaceae bacterium]